MAQISIDETHELGAEEAKRRIDEYVDELAHSTFPGVTVEGVQKKWNGSRLDTSFRARKSFFSQKISGTAEVGESSVRLDVEVPDMVFSLVPRQQIESAVRKNLRAKLA